MTAMTVMTVAIEPPRCGTVPAWLVRHRGEQARALARWLEPEGVDPSTPARCSEPSRPLRRCR